MAKGYFGEFGGQFVGETLMPPLLELEAAFQAATRDPKFKRELADMNRDFVGRSTKPKGSRRRSAARGSS
jgi:tryptophan synthase beta chain